MIIEARREKYDPRSRSRGRRVARDARANSPRDCGLHVRQPDDARQGRLDLRADRNPRQAPIRPGDLAGHLDAGDEHRDELAGPPAARSTSWSSSASSRGSSTPIFTPVNTTMSMKTGKGDKISIADASEAFHVYAIEWDAQKIDFFVDGRKYFTFRNEGTGPDVWPYDKDQYLILNLAIGGDWGGQKGIDDGIFPSVTRSTMSGSIKNRLKMGKRLSVDEKLSAVRRLRDLEPSTK